MKNGNLTITPTKTQLGLEGANANKENVRVGGRLSLKKDVLQSNSYDNYCEVLYMLFADHFGVPCCRALCGDDYSVSVFEDSWQRKVDAETLLGLSRVDAEQLFSRIERLCQQREVIQGMVDLLTLDVILRQVDRNTTNLSFILDENGAPLNLYPAYDNGLCLFSTFKVSPDNNYRTVLGYSDDILAAVRRRGTPSFIGERLETSTANAIMSEAPDVFTNGNLGCDVADWVIAQYRYVQDFFKRGTVSALSLE